MTRTCFIGLIALCHSCLAYPAEATVNVALPGESGELSAPAETALAGGEKKGCSPQKTGAAATIGGIIGTILLPGVGTVLLSAIAAASVCTYDVVAGPRGPRAAQPGD